VAGITRRVGAWVRPPGRRHLTVFAALTGASQTEALLSVLGSVVLVRAEGAETAGRVFFAQAAAALWFTFADPKLDDAIQRFVPQEQAAGRGRGSALFDRLLRLDALAGSAGTAAGMLGTLFAAGAGWLDAGQAWLLLLALAAAGAAAPLGTIGAGFAVAGDLRRLGVLRFATAAVSFALSVGALLAAGPTAYLAAAAVAAAASTWLLAGAARRAVRDALGPPAEGPVGTPPRMWGFAAKSMAAASAAMLSERGLLVLAGALAGPYLVTYLKIAGAPGRLYHTFVTTASAQLHPRLAAAAVAGDGAAIRRDTLRVSVLLTGLGAVTMLAGAALTAPAITIVYGPAYAWLAGPTVILLGAACLHGAVVWAKVLAPALGRPGIRLCHVLAEGALTLAVLALACRYGGAPERIPAVYAWGAVAISLARVGSWLAVLRVFTAKGRIVV